MNTTEIEQLPFKRFNITKGVVITAGFEEGNEVLRQADDLPCAEDIGMSNHSR